MKNLLMFVLSVSIVACATFHTTSNYEKGTDFSKYKTYQLSDLKLDPSVKNINQEAIMKAVDNEMSKIGLVKSENADIVVEGMVVGSKYEKNPIAVAGYTYNTYTEGSYLVSFIDKADNKIIWQGSASRTLNEGSTPEKQEATITKMVHKMLKEYPAPKK